MKKLLSLLLTALLAVHIVAPSYAAQTQIMTPAADPVIPVYYNGQLLETPISPILEDNRCLVPFRAIFEALGAVVHYDETTRLITASRDDILLKMIPGDPIADLSGIRIELDVAPMIYRDYTLVPLRFVGEAMGAQVVWDYTAREVRVQYTPPVVEEPTPDSDVILHENGLNESILGEPEVTLLQAKTWALARRATEKFIAAADYYWRYGALTGIRPEVLYCQAAKETGFGRYGGAVTEDMNNFAGIKTADADGDETHDHETFASLEDGVRGHFNHISAYVGLDPIGEPHARYYNVLSLSWAGTIRTVTELGGRWAPSTDYGESILNDYLKKLIEFDLS